MADNSDKPEQLNQEDLFARLSPEGQAAAPVAYRFFHPSTLGASTILRLAESRPYRTAGYVCNTFRKPVSKCCEPDDV